MCDYCDCRSIPEIGALSEEHERILALTHVLRHRNDSLDDSAVAVVVDQLRSALLPHTLREERGVFTVLASVDVDPAYRRRFLDEHDDIDEALDRAMSDPGGIDPLVELVERHVFEEETDLYPALRQVFAPTDWDRVEALLVHLDGVANVAVVAGPHEHVLVD